jgi:hypothetical protein
MAFSSIHGRCDPKESAYYRLFAESDSDCFAEELGMILSKCHACTISNGSKLDSELIPSPEFNANTVQTKCSSKQADWNTIRGHFSKFRVQKDDLPHMQNKKAMEIDYLMIDNGAVHIFEIKDGDNFDTKKSKGEVQSLLMLKTFFQDKMPSHTVHVHMVFWNCKDIPKHALKTTLGECNMMNGEEFSHLVNCNYTAINEARRMNAKVNKAELVQALKKLLDINQ